LTRRLLPVLALLLTPALGLAGESRPPDTRSPYVGLEGREVKALGPEEVRALLAGEGMRMALPAELNHYPGPRHVLDLAAELNLSPAQRAATERVFERMKAEAVRLGRLVIEREAALDRAFAERTIDEASLRALVAEVARLRGEVRAAHLAAHLETRRILSDAQVARYDELRGYAKGGAPQHGAPQHGPTEQGDHPGGHRHGTR
jgi:Spy/CpxP family protein refolding chaperone